MLTAQQARELSNEAVEANHKELCDKLSSVINSAIKQGSFKAEFYPRNDAQSQLAVSILTTQGFLATLRRAKDQRDVDTIHIGWEV